MNKYKDSDLLLMFKIRYFELCLLDLFSKGLIKGTTHTSLGQEYIPVSLKPFINEKDFIISNHRGHGHFIALTGEIEGLLSEITGKEGGICNSIGGSQHLLYKNIMTTGVQGEGVSIALGHAFKFKHEKTKNACFVFIGDGTFGRGSVYESLNMASLYKLPYILIIENNSIAMTTKLAENMAGTIENRIKAFDVDYIKITSSNPDEIRKQIKEPILNAKENSTPLAVEFVTQRVASHSKGDDTREEEEMEFINKNYWYNKLKNEKDGKFLELDNLAKREIETITNEVLSRKELEFVE